jgi:hypothetical protein
MGLGKHAFTLFFVGLLLLIVLSLVLGMNDFASVFAVAFTGLVGSVVLVMGVYHISQSRLLWGAILTGIGFFLIGAIWAGWVQL